MDGKLPNPPRTTSNVWWIITALAIFGIFAPELFGLKMFSGGAAISVVCILLAITGLIVALIYMARAGKLDKILKGSDLIAHWTYSPDEWQQYTEEEYQRQKSGNRGLFILIAVISLVIGIIYFIADHRNGQWVLLTMVGLIALMAFVAWFTAYYNHRQNKQNRGEAFFAPDALYINRQLHDFKGLGAKLENVALKGDSQQYIEFTYSAPTRTGRQDYQARVPIPQGKDDEARTLVEKYNSL
jgi:protein-S-isoprenylcysteine O-methyltransferase Ste14